MPHRYTHRDVKRAFERYRTLTGDKLARLEHQVTEPPIYRVVTSEAAFRGFEAYGAFSMWSALEMYCNGFEDGRRATTKPA